MRKAHTTTRALLLLTLFFMLIAAFSFAAFQETKTLCSGTSQKCNQSAPAKSTGGGMIWDDFSRSFTACISLR